MEQTDVERSVSISFAFESWTSIKKIEKKKNYKNEKQEEQASLIKNYRAMQMVKEK